MNDINLLLKKYNAHFDFLSYDFCAVFGHICEEIRKIKPHNTHETES